MLERRGKVMEEVKEDNVLRFPFFGGSKECNTPINYNGKVIGKTKRIEFDEATMMLYQYVEIEDEEAWKEIRGKINNV